MVFDGTNLSLGNFGRADQPVRSSALGPIVRRTRHFPRPISGASSWSRPSCFTSVSPLNLQIYFDLYFSRTSRPPTPPFCYIPLVSLFCCFSSNPPGACLIIATAHTEPRAHFPLHFPTQFLDLALDFSYLSSCVTLQALSWHSHLTRSCSLFRFPHRLRSS